MFEYANSHYTKRPPNRRLIGAGMVSCVGHLAALWVLMTFPGLLRPGMHLWFHPPTLFSKPPEESNWRNLVYLGGSPKLQSPSATTLKKYLYNWEKDEESKAPPVRVSWRGDLLPSRGNSQEPAPAVQPTLGTREPKPVPASGQTASAKVEEGGGKPGEEGRGEAPGLVALPPLTGRVPTVYLPAPSQSEPRQIPKKVAESAGATPPGEIPDSPASTAEDKKLVNQKQAKEEPKTFANEQQAIRTEGSGLFDTKGFPLGEYARIIIERIKGNWSIPSNLRSSQGRSTIIFFIEKDGQVTNLRIVGPSGSSSLDLAAQNAVWTSKPFPPLPRGFPGEHVGAKFVFSYNEQQ